MRVIGLMSGTSLDGIDAAVIDISGSAEAPAWSLIAFDGSTYTTEQREAIHDAITRGTAEALCRLHADLGEWLADAALRARALAGGGVDLIGSHGQTVWHIPPTAQRRGATLQIGCAATIAERTGVPVVSDFRSRDVAASGQGAPLVPWADRWLFSHATRARVLVNIGGMANLTWVPPRSESGDVLAFDTGPGNALIDAAISIATDGRATYDDSGAMAAQSSPDDALLDELLRDSFFQTPPPRSTGREVFGRPMVEQLLGSVDRVTRAQSMVSTFTELTARTIADGITHWVKPRRVDEVIVTGGGARNATLMRRLAALLAPVPVITGDAAGINGDAKEAIVFAALAWAHVERIPGNMPSATGARGPRVLGSYTPGA